MTRDITTVAIGGGTGLPRVLRALMACDRHPAAVVTMADDGGSSGRLREELGVLPPGDIRNCLAALARNERLAQLMQYRFEGGECLGGHSLGNLMLAALADMSGGFTEGIRVAEELLECDGRVLPSTLDDVRLVAQDVAGVEVRGQARIAHNERRIARVWCEPGSPAANPEAVAAVDSADLVVVGPGSLFTSVLPNFLAEDMREALRRCRGLRVYVCNVANQRGETSGMGVADHFEALLEHGLAGAFDVVLAHCPREGAESPSASAAPGVETIEVTDADMERIRSAGAQVRLADLVTDDPMHHDVGRLTEALQEMIDEAAALKEAGDVLHG